MSLHDKIMNLQCNLCNANGVVGDIILSYKQGHRDARHAAAELVIEYDEEIERLKELNGELFKQLNKTFICIELSNECFGDMDAMRRIIKRYKNEQ